MAYTTAAELKTYLGITGSGDDALLTALISAAQKAIERYTGRVFEASADSTRYLDAVRCVDTQTQTLFLDRDLCAITSVTVNADADDGGDVLSTTDYIVQPRNETPYYALKMANESTYDWDYTDDPENGIKIVGKWAYSTTAPADIQHACKRLAAYMYRQKDAQVFDTIAIPDAGVITTPQGVPVDVRMMLDPYKVTVGAYGI